MRRLLLILTLTFSCLAVCNHGQGQETTSRALPPGAAWDQLNTANPKSPTGPDIYRNPFQTDGNQSDIYKNALPENPNIVSANGDEENTAIACADGIDNDGNGLIDCDDPSCQALSDNNEACETCFGDGLSFADEVIEYVNGCPDQNTTANDPQKALGAPDPNTPGTYYVTLGEGGSIKLLFTNNTLINSGDSDPDMYVFEIGAVVESSTIELRPTGTSTEALLLAAGITDSDGDGFYEFGQVAGSTASIDIDSFFDDPEPSTLFFDAVKITDVPATICSGGTPGADIDGVCALSSLSCAVGDPCDDGDPNTQNDTFNEDCECVGTIIHDCPELEANIGDDCDDGNPDTENDTVNADCDCEGEIPTGTTEVNETAFSVYPNPVVDQFTVEMNGENIGVFEYAVLYDVHGRAVAEFQLRPTAKNRLSIPRPLPTGLYSLKFVGMDKTAFEKVVVRR